MDQHTADQRPSDADTSPAARVETNADRRASRRPVGVAALLVLILAANLFALYTLTRRAASPPDPFDLDATPTALRVLAVVAAANIVSAVAIWRRHRWGFFALAISAVIATAINVVVLGENLGVLGLALIPVLYVALRSLGPRGGEWSRLDPTSAPDRRWLAAGGAVVVAAIVAPLVLATVTRGAGGGLAITQDGDALNGYVVVMNSDGSERRQLTGKGSGRQMIESRVVDWSPDGSRLLFESRLIIDRRTRDRDLFVVDADGGDMTKLTDAEFGGSAAWSPDGSRVLLEHDDMLVTIDVDSGLGGDTTVAILDQADFRTAGGWTPDGEQVYFVDDRQLFLASADGSGAPRQVGDGAIPVLRVYLSPDGERFAIGGTGFDGESEVFVMDIDGSNVEQLSFNGVPDALVGWTPDGSQLVVNRGDAQEGVVDVYTVAVDGSGDRRLTDADGVSFAGAISPDGDEIAYSRSDPAAGPSGSAAYQDSREIWVVGIDGSDKRQITSNDVGERVDAWTN